MIDFIIALLLNLNGAVQSMSTEETFQEKRQRLQEKAYIEITENEDILKNNLNVTRICLLNTKCVPFKPE